MAKSKKQSKKKAITKEMESADSPWIREKKKKVSAVMEKIEMGKFPEQEIRQRLQSFQYRMEYYLLTPNKEIGQIRTIQYFLKSILAELGIPLKTFATSIDTTDANLRKYLNGDRSFSLELAMRFAAFFQIPAELWLNIQTKNAVIELQQDSEAMANYSRYNYKNIQK
jgi:plasmid maintenance system antidote protein VapI